VETSFDLQTQTLAERAVAEVRTALSDTVL